MVMTIAVFDILNASLRVQNILFTDKMTNFATQNMNRTFHYKASFLNYAVIIVTAVCALFVLWDRSAANAVVGVALMIAVVLMVERIIHTSYIFTDDGLLVVSKGRFSHVLSVRVSDIVSAEIVCAGVLPVKYVLLKYGAGHEISLQPVNGEAFISEIRRRQKHAEEMDG